MNNNNNNNNKDPRRGVHRMASLDEPKFKYESKINSSDDIPRTDPEWHAFKKKKNV